MWILGGLTKIGVSQTALDYGPEIIFWQLDIFRL